jgi:hypothetical protein
LESPEVRRMRIDGCRFVVTHTHNGQTVTIEQVVILKVSLRVTSSHQSPARIHLNGKFVDEAAYKGSLHDLYEIVR